VDGKKLAENTPNICKSLGLKGDEYMERRNLKKHEVALTTLKKGETGKVCSIKAGHGRGRVFEKRLMDVGLIPGT